MVRQQDSSPQSDESTPNLLNTAFSESNFSFATVEHLTAVYSPTDSVFEELSSKTQIETAEKCEVPQKSADVESKYCETDVTTKDRSELEELREKLRKTQDALNSEREEVELQNQLHCRLSELEPPLQVYRLVQCVQ